MSDLASAIGVRADEQVFVAELQAGSEQAFHLLLAQYGQPIYSLVARMLRSPDDAADVTQEVFVKVFRNIASFHGEASLRTQPVLPEKNTAVRSGTATSCAGEGDERGANA